MYEAKTKAELSRLRDKYRRFEKETAHVEKAKTKHLADMSKHADTVIEKSRIGIESYVNMTKQNLLTLGVPGVVDLRGNDTSGSSTASSTSSRRRSVSSFSSQYSSSSSRRGGAASKHRKTGTILLILPLLLPLLRIRLILLLL